ncbi:E3 ubiquitin-protein ligase MARCH5 [Cucumispora dikerogammari]|nr:E3 ubiquitin-protein ligase MARCH5 [Cucumispora dikerogammari]
MALKQILGEKHVLSKASENTIESICKICLENEGNHNEDVLISPCKCKGSIKFVHRECLRRWRYHKKNLSTINYCDQCSDFYEAVDEFLPRKFLISIFTFLSFLSIIFLANFVLTTLLEAYVYTYKICNTPTIDDLLKGRIYKQSKSLEVLEEVLEEASIFKVMVYFAFVNILFTFSKSNCVGACLYFLFLMRSFFLGRRLDNYFLVTFSALNLKSFYYKIYDYIYETVLYLLNC